ncbi:hypothetical protein Hanom_Chr10g00938351 [Helianthus anomalus]
MTEEEMMNESKMTYGPKNCKPSVNVRPVEKQVVKPVCFVSKGTFDPNASSSCADEVPEVRWGDMFGNEPPLDSDVSKPTFDKTDSGCVFGQSFLNSFHSYVSSSFGPDVLGKTVNACDETLNNVRDDGCFSVAKNCDSNVSNSSADDNVTGEVPQDAFSETTKLLLKRINRVLILLLNRSQWKSLMLNLVGFH